MVCRGNRHLIGSNAVTTHCDASEYQNCALQHIVAETKIMQEVIGKPIEPSVPGAAVANSPPKPTNPPIRQRILGQGSQYPLLKNALVSKPILHPVSSIEAELAEMDRAWRKYRSINDRDAVYIYLASVFKVVMRWQRLDCALQNARTALRLQADAPQMKPEPFGLVIFCTADPRIVDAKTRSKWSRVLRYAARAKPAGQRFTDFVKSNGSLNECARRFARDREACV
jgi:hypothetical protein